MRVTLNYLHLENFKRSWPCHGLPDNLNSLAFDFDARNGDLVDIEARDGLGLLIDSADFDGPALVALSQDAQALGLVAA